MYKTLRDILKLQFPVYAVNSDNFYQQDGITFLDNRIIDDLNKPGASIGLRRLQSGRENLYRLKGPIYSVREIITGKKKNFISSCGTPFTYVKERFQTIKTHEIKKIEGKNSFSLLWVQGVSIPIEILRPPSDPGLTSWARILYYDKLPWTLYDYSYFPQKPVRIKV